MNLHDTFFGVEIEMLVPVATSRDTLAQLLTDAGARTEVQSYNHRPSTVWKIVTDASLRSELGFYTVELVSPSTPPLKGEDGFEQVMAVGRVLTRLGCKVNRSCGLHVHVDATTMPIDVMRRLALVYADAEGIIDTLMPPSRRGSANVYCGTVARANRTALVQSQNASAIAMAINGGSRFAKLNFTSYWRHRTVEFRHHSGTVDGAKILSWVKFCLRMVKFATTSTVSFTTGAPMPINVRAGTKRALLVEMLMRPMGATRNELLAATGARTLSLGALSRAAGVAIRRGRRVNGGFTRYHAETRASLVPTAGVNDTPMTFEALCDRLGFEGDERAFWTARRDFLRNALTPAE